MEAIGGFVTGHYVFLVLAAILTFGLLLQTQVKDKIEHFALGFFLMTGNFNDALTFKVPGVSFFEIQPDRFLFLLFSFYLFRKLFFSKEQQGGNFSTGKVPVFLIFLVLNMLFIIISLFANLGPVEFKDAMVSSVNILNFGIIILALQRFLTKESIDFLGKTIIICAVFSSIISVLQVAVDPAFLRVGDFRGAFGSVLRANGIFKAEYTNGYILITAIIWTLTTMRNHALKFLLIGFFTLGVFLTFHRMSWLVLAIVLTVYFLMYERPALTTLSFLSLGGLSLLIVLFISFHSNIMNSSLVQERLNDSIDGRKGYYTMVLDNYDKRPIFGFGNRNNEVYFHSMMQITRKRERATGEEGGIHNGYFEILFFYGVPAFLSFILFIFSGMIYFWRLSRFHLFFAIPLLFTIVYAMSNMSNTLNYGRYLSVIFAIILGIGMAARHLKEYQLKTQVV